MKPTPPASLHRDLQAFKFRHLFVEGLGWDHCRETPIEVRISDYDYALHPVAEKSGFLVLECAASAERGIPTYPIRQKIESAVTKRAFEHLIIFTDAHRGLQIWQWVKRESGRVPACRELEYTTDQSGQPLLQRLQPLFVSLDEEPSLDITEVSGRVKAAFDVEKITKRFYDAFRKELTVFGECIMGIAVKGDRDWYASLMLNRMMFVYFIQKQSFLDNDVNYLRNRLKRIQAQATGDRFQEFYRLFLMRLFHEGLSIPESDRPPELVQLLGRVPFLNGGLFDVHYLEQYNPDLNIPDRAFERIFDFFDGYHWHLDERAGRADNEINPDVLGYIFEQYVNQKQMGAYYTKEDITGYMSRNTIIPFLFDVVKVECPDGFDSDGGVWRLLRHRPDRYVYPVVGHGITWNAHDADSPMRLNAPHGLPDKIASGVCDVSKRSDWNLSASEEYPEHALPTETWREVLARRQRFREIHDQLTTGGVTDIDDCVTLNLDTEQFASDVISQTEDAELLLAFWSALRSISVLDPTCGSGAFLFAALNVLEPLYTTCLEGMRGHVGDWERSGRSSRPDTIGQFHAILAQVSIHPNERYFILKSIVLNNLYGVDIMEEAVEICKLRLFLKLVAQLDSVAQIEPLPDVDFNVRAGNALVGFTSLDAIKQAMTITPEGQYRQVLPQDEKALIRIEQDAETISIKSKQFRLLQTSHDGGMGAAHKVGLEKQLSKLRSQLDRHLASDYGVATEDSRAFERWKTGHQPFHWFGQFHDIMARGGFDVVVGNPPYISRTKLAPPYTLKDFQTAECPDIYAPVVERSVDLLRTDGRVGMIVSLNLACGLKYASLRSYLYETCDPLWFSHFGRIPAPLFTHDTRIRNTIVLGRKSARAGQRMFTTRLHRWSAEKRPALLADLSYVPFSLDSFGGLVPKIGSAALLGALVSLMGRHGYRLGQEFSTLSYGAELDFKQTAYNWLTFCIERQPPAFGPQGAPIRQTSYKSLSFRNTKDRDLSFLLASGKLMFIWWCAMGDDFHLTKNVIGSLPFGPGQLTENKAGEVLARKSDLEMAMAENVEFKANADKTIGNYNLAKCRSITDVVDKIWLEAVELEGVWEEVELEYAWVVRTQFGEAADV